MAQPRDRPVNRRLRRFGDRGLSTGTAGWGLCGILTVITILVAVAMLFFSRHARSVQSLSGAFVMLATSWA